MNAIILCDLKNYSLKEQTEKTAISLISINNEKILKKQLDILKNCGIINIYLTVGFGGDAIIKFVRDKYFDDFNINIIVNYFWETLNSSHSLLLALEKMPKESFILFEGNKIFNQELITSLLNNPNKNICVVRKKTKYSPRSLKVVVNKHSRIIRIDKDKLGYKKKKWLKKPKIVGFSSGIYKFTNITNRIHQELKRTPSTCNFEYSINEMLKANQFYPLAIQEPMKLIKCRNIFDLKKAQEII